MGIIQGLYRDSIGFTVLGLSSERLGFSPESKQQAWIVQWSGLVDCMSCTLELLNGIASLYVYPSLLVQNQADDTW